MSLSFKAIRQYSGSVNLRVRIRERVRSKNWRGARAGARADVVHAGGRAGVRLEADGAAQLRQRRALLAAPLARPRDPAGRPAARDSGRPAGRRSSRRAGSGPGTSISRPDSTKPTESIASQKRCLSRSRPSCARRRDVGGSSATRRERRGRPRSGGAGARAAAARRCSPRPSASCAPWRAPSSRHRTPRSAPCRRSRSASASISREPTAEPLEQPLGRLVRSAVASGSSGTSQ